MEWLCKGKGIVMGMNLIVGTFGCKSRDSCVYNKTVQKQGSFSSVSAWDIKCKLKRWWFIGNVGCVVSESNTSCHSALD